MLSSIRRLVSDKKAPQMRESEVETDLFLLTPAHRVVQKAEQPEPAVDSSNLLAEGPAEVAQPSDAAAELPNSAANGDELPVAHWADQAAATLESRIAELERAIGGSDEQFEPDGSEPDAENEPELHLLEQYRDRFAHVRLSEIGIVGSDEANDPAADDDGPLQLADVAIFTHTPRRAEDEDAAPQEGDMVTEPEPPEVPAEDAVAQAAESFGTPELEVVPNTEPAAEVEVVADPDEDIGDADLVEELTELLDEMPDEPEPAVEEAVVVDIETHTAEAEETVLAADEASDAELAVEADPDLAEVHELSAPAHADVWDADDDLLVDEELLRQVVSDIVREELQGRLGERITRNVRRMVRQEIERAMSVKSLK